MSQCYKLKYKVKDIKILNRNKLLKMNTLEIIIVDRPKAKDFYGLSFPMTQQDFVILISRCTMLTIKQIEELDVVDYFGILNIIGAFMLEANK